MAHESRRGTTSIVTLSWHDRSPLTLATNGGIASNIPDQSVLIPSLGPGEVVLFQRSGAALPLAGNRGAVSTITTEVCAFSGDDIILISTTNDATAYNSRTDIIGSVGTNAAINWGPNTSLIKG